MRVLILAAALSIAACARSAVDPPADQWRSIDVLVAPAMLGAEQVGRLRFRGGLELRPAHRDDLGGLSGLEVLQDGSLIAVSDRGEWFEAQLVLDPSGALAGLEAPRTAPMLDEHGARFPSKRDGDAEGLAQLLDGRFAVSFEQTQTIRIYDLNRDGPFGAARPGPVLAGAERLPANAGLEALTSTGEDALLVGAEGGAGDATPLWLAPLSSTAPVAPAALYPLRRGYSLTGLDRLPDGGYVAIERFYAPVIGVRIRITRFGADLVGDAARGALRVEELAFLAHPLSADNFESIAAVRQPGGGVRLYIISDDNFSDRQRTLLYAFDVVEDAAAASPGR